jgi:membrane associated rhomboid family serine protease
MDAMEIALYQDTAGSGRPWSAGPDPDERPQREPMFNAPLAAIVLVGAIIAGYAVQTRFPGDSVAEAFAFAPVNLLNGRWLTLFSAMFVHGSWGHALTNAAFALAFASPVARFFGERWTGVIYFFAFYLLCGAASNLGFAAVHWGSPGPLVGASGALSGLMGVAARLVDGQGRLGRLFSRSVLSMGGAWIIVNLLIAVLGSAWVPGTGGQGVAWEAHVAGFIAGAILIGPFAWITRRA